MTDPRLSASAAINNLGGGMLAVNKALNDLRAATKELEVEKLSRRDKIKLALSCYEMARMVDLLGQLAGEAVALHKLITDRLDDGGAPELSRCADGYEDAKRKLTDELLLTIEIGGAA